MPWCVAEEASQYLWKWYRLKRNPRRLAQLRASGDGPKYYRDGLVVRYREADLDEWAEQQLGEPLVSTAQESEHKHLFTKRNNSIDKVA
jgi:hypothetical protein